jgi:hypothetical protein
MRPSARRRRLALYCLAAALVHVAGRAAGEGRRLSADGSDVAAEADVAAPLALGDLVIVTATTAERLPLVHATRAARYASASSPVFLLLLMLHMAQEGPSPVAVALVSPPLLNGNTPRPMCHTSS